VLELTGLVLVPGFWNSHVHFSGTQWAGADTAAPARLAESVRAMLTRWGFTTVFDTGSELENTLALRRRIEAGAVDGPKIFTTGDILFPVGAPRGRFHVGTPNEAVAATTALLDGGADAIKVYAQAFWDLSLKLSPDVRPLSWRKRIAEAFRCSLTRPIVMVSTTPSVRVWMCRPPTPQIGPWGNELVAKMKASNIALIPTLKLWRFELARENVPAPDIETFQRRGIAQLREYHSAGGAILFGTDVGYMTDFSTLEEFQKMSEAGMGFRDILASLTTTPAARRGLGASTGKLAVGFDGDLVVLGSDPARSVDAFADVAYTIRGGRVIYRVTRR
jgi:imidazolonepropionase-like amidohydrolase